MLVLSPDPEKVAGHAEQDRASGGCNRGDKVVDSEPRQQIRESPPDYASARAGNMELPETRPGRTTMAENPAIIDQKAERQHRLRAGGCRSDQRQMENSAENVKDTERARSEGQSDDPPAYERPGLELLDQRTAKRWSWRRDLNPRPAVYKTAALPTELRQRPHLDGNDVVRLHASHSRRGFCMMLHCGQ
jgi:hypothetical protein